MNPIGLVGASAIIIGGAHGPEKWQRVIEIYSIGVFNCCCAAPGGAAP